MPTRQGVPVGILASADMTRPGKRDDMRERDALPTVGANLPKHPEAPHRGKAWVVALVAIACLVTLQVSGCAALRSKLNDIKGSLIGNAYTIETYDNSGHLTLTTHGSKVDMESNKVAEEGYDSDGSAVTNYSMSAVVTITIDGREIETCGDTCIFAQDGLEKEVDFTNPETIESVGGASLGDVTSIAYQLNRFRNAFGKARIVVVKSQLGTPICAYSGDDVYYEVCEDLPKTTKIMVDGRALYVHRANFQIVDKDLLD